MSPPLVPVAAALLAAPLSGDPLTLAVLGVLSCTTLVALVLAVLLVRQLRAERTEGAARERALSEDLADQLDQVERRLVAHRNESATFLQAIFTGVQGLARNLDAARSTSVMTLEEVRQKIQAQGEKPFAENRFDTVPDLSPPVMVPPRPRKQREPG